MKVKEITQGSLIGPLHIAQDLPNQDYARSSVSDDYAIIALADGAGSLARSHEGAKLAVDTFIEIVESAFVKDEVDSLESLVQKTFVKVAEVIAEAGLTDDGGCTLVVGLFYKGEVIVAAVGDSFAVIQLANDELYLLQPPPAGEFANITKLVTSDSYVLSTFVVSVDAVKSIAICSDAFDLPTLQKREPVKNFWSNVFSMAHRRALTAESLLDFMKSKDKLDDDATIILACFDIDNVDAVSGDYKNFDYDVSSGEFVEIAESIVTDENIVTVKASDEVVESGIVVVSEETSVE